jgi:hypothetical protein
VFSPRPSHPKRKRRPFNDILWALGLDKWDLEDEDDVEEEEEEGDGEGEGATRMETPTPGGKGKKQALSTRSSSNSRTSRSFRSSGNIKAEDISSDLANKGASEKRKLDIQEKKLMIENNKARLEGIAMFVKSGIDLEDVKKTWNGGKL